MSRLEDFSSSLSLSYKHHLNCLCYVNVVPISNAPAVSCPIHGNFGKMETAEKRNDNTRKVFDVKEREDIRKELARIFEEICIITDKIRSEVGNLIFFFID